MSRSVATAVDSDKKRHRNQKIMSGMGYFLQVFASRGRNSVVIGQMAGPVAAAGGVTEIRAKIQRGNAKKRRLIVDCSGRTVLVGPCWWEWRRRGISRLKQ
jgi:hypothetical protein